MALNRFPNKIQPDNIRFFDALDDFDKKEFLELYHKFNEEEQRRVPRNTRVDNFQEVLDSVKQFCIRHDNNDMKRCLACGVAFTDDGIAINTNQFSQLFGKCKSSVNGSLLQIGYSANGGLGKSMITKTIPILKDDQNELRRWTFRKFDPQNKKIPIRKNIKTPRPLVPRINLDSLYHPPPVIEGAPKQNPDNLSLVEPEPQLVPLFDINVQNSSLWSMNADDYSEMNFGDSFTFGDNNDNDSDYSLYDPSRFY